MVSCLFRDTICLIDWKTSKKQKASLRYTYDNPLQVAAYLGAYNADPKYKDMKTVCYILIYSVKLIADLQKMLSE